MLSVLDPKNRNQPFPDVAQALEEPNGLLAVGGCLSTQRLLNAYRHGVFPWFGEGEPILWWSPDPRLVLLPEWLVVTRSLRKLMRRGTFRFSFDTCFNEVLAACAEPRAYATATWITPAMNTAYAELHRLGWAHSFEAWQGGELVGGLYGVAIGRVFFGESMFHRVSNASKAAFVFAVETLHQWGYVLIDCQVHTPHLQSLGAREISRDEFIRVLAECCDRSARPDAWRVDSNAP
jgi:leucyl/phenylalanyl-tRNA--protein transferase